MEISVTKRTAKNFTWLSIGDLISRGLNFFAFIYLARVLGAAAFGLLNFAQAFLMYLLLLVDSGLSLLGAREVAKVKEKVGAISLNIFAIRFIIALSLFIVSSSILFFLPLNQEVRLLFLATFLFVFYRALNADWAFQGLEKMEYIALSRSLFSIMAFLGIILLVKNSADLVKVPLVQFAGGIAVSLLLLYLLFKRFAPVTLEHLSPRNWWDYFSEAIPLAASAFLIQIYCNLDTIMLGFMDRAETVGYYNAAYKILFAFSGFLGLWQSTVFPIVSVKISRDTSEAQAFLNKYLRLTFIFIIPAVVLVSFLSLPIIKLLYGNTYGPASPALQILIWSMLFIVVSGIYGILIMIPMGKTRDFFYAAVAGAFMNVALNFLLIPRYSFVGASVATVISEAAVAAAMYLLIRKQLRIEILRSIHVPLLASLLASFALFFSLGGAVVFLAVYVFLIAVLGEREFLMGFINEVLRKEGQ